MRKILDKMFENKKLSILLPILISAFLYLLFIIFGVSEDKMNIKIVTLIGSVFWFFGSFLVVYVQVKKQELSRRIIESFRIGGVIILWNFFDYWYNCCCVKRISKL